MDEFGFDAIFDGGANEQEAAGPVEEESAEQEQPEEDGGANEQEAAGPVEEGEKEQTAEENAAFANIRRKAEEEARLKIKTAVDDERKKFDSMIGNLGLMNPFTGKSLASVDDLSAYADAMREEQKKISVEKMEQAGYSRDEIEQVINDLVANHPDVRKATESVKELETMKREATEAKVQRHVAAEIEKIKAYDPNINNFNDIIGGEKGEEITAMIKRGYSLSDAYYLANKDTIGQRAAERSRQEAINATRGKEHMQKSVSRGDGGVVIPSDVIAEYQQLNPGMSVEDIRKWVARDQKRMKR